MTKRISYSPTKSLEAFIARYQAKHSLSRPQEVIHDALFLLEEEELVELYNQCARKEALGGSASSESQSCDACGVHVDQPRVRRGEVYRLKVGTLRTTGLVLVVSDNAGNRSGLSNLDVLEVEAASGDELPELEATFELASQRLKVCAWGLSRITKDLLEPLPLGSLSGDELKRVEKLLALRLRLG